MKMPVYPFTWSSPLLLPGLPQGRPGRKSAPGTASGRFMRRIAQVLCRVSATAPQCTRLRVLSALPLLVLAFVTQAHGQVIPALKAPPRISVFTTFTDVKPDYQHWGDEAVYGFSLGGIIQSHHIFGLEARGSIVRWGGLEHQEYALVGPRAALHLGRISPYFDVLGGAAHVWKWHDMPRKYAPIPKLDEGLGPQWTICGGLDLHLSHHFALRVGELGYSQIYATSHSLSQLNASTGIVYHIN